MRKRDSGTGFGVVLKRLREEAGLSQAALAEKAGMNVFGVAKIEHGIRWVKLDEFAYHQVVSERMTPRRLGAVAAEARFLKENTDRRVKVCLPSPYLIGQRMWMPEHSTAAYPTREAFCEALVPVLREELLRVREIGVDVVQLDEPHLCVLVDPNVRAKFADPEAEM